MMIRSQSPGPRRLTALRLLPLLLGLVLTPITRAGVSHSYRVSVDTSGVSGSSGYLNFQFNPATTDSTPAATATVSGLAGYSGSLTRVAPFYGDVLGDPSSTLTLGNTDALNDYYATVTFGNSLDFLLNLDGDAFNAVTTNGSTFTFALYDATENPLNGTNPAVAVLDLVPDGVNPGVSIDIFTGAAYSGGADATVTVTAVPEASTIMMGGLIALAGLVAARRGGRPAG